MAGVKQKMKDENKPPRQVVGNVGLFFLCYLLSRRGWNVLTTSRNAMGVDIVIYSQTAKRTRTIQAKSLSEKNPVPLGSNKRNLIAEFLVVCREVMRDNPDVFILTMDEVLERMRETEKDGEKHYWLQPEDYIEEKDRWDKIGDGYE